MRGNLLILGLLLDPDKEGSRLKGSSAGGILGGAKTNEVSSWKHIFSFEKSESEYKCSKYETQPVSIFPIEQQESLEIRYKKIAKPHILGGFGFINIIVDNNSAVCVVRLFEV